MHEPPRAHLPLDSRAAPPAAMRCASRAARLSTPTAQPCAAVAAADVCGARADPQLDPRQNRRRVVQLPPLPLPPLSGLQQHDRSSVSSAQSPQTAQPRLLSPQRARRRPAAGAAAGGQAGRSRAPPPGSVQDQSSGALLLLPLHAGISSPGVSLAARYGTDGSAVVQHARKGAGDGSVGIGGAVLRPVLLPVWEGQKWTQPGAGEKQRRADGRPETLQQPEARQRRARVAGPRPLALRLLVKLRGGGSRLLPMRHLWRRRRLRTQPRAGGAAAVGEQQQQQHAASASVEPPRWQGGACSAELRRACSTAPAAPEGSAHSVGSLFAWFEGHSAAHPPNSCPGGTGAGAAGAAANAAASVAASADADAAAGEDAAARRLAHAIRSCRTWLQLRDLADAHGAAVNAAHVTQVLAALVRKELPPPPRAEQGPAAAAAADADAAADAAQRANAHGVTAVAAPGGPRWRPSEDTEQLAVFLGRLEAAFGEEVARAASSAAARPARLGLHAARAPAARSLLGPWRLSQGLGALARLRAEGWPVGGDAALARAAASAAAGWRFDSFSPQALVMLLHAMAKLGHRPSDAWLAAAAGAVGAHAGGAGLPPRLLSTALWAFAVLRWRPPAGCMEAWLAGSADAMPAFRPYDISQALWALAVLQRLGQEAEAEEERREGVAAEEEEEGGDAAIQALESQQQRQQQQQAPGEGALRAAARDEAAPWDGVLPRAWASAALRQCASAMRAHRALAQPQDVCNALWAVARLRLYPPPSWVAAVAAPLLNGPQPGALERRSAGIDVAGVLWALGRLRAAPPAGHMGRLMAAAGARAHGFSGQDCANALWGAAAVAYVPPRGVLVALGRRVAALAAAGQLEPRAVVAVLWSCARLRAPPGEGLLQPLLAAAMRAAPRLTPHEAALLLYCVARLVHLRWLPQPQALATTASAPDAAAACGQSPPGGPVATPALSGDPLQAHGASHCADAAAAAAAAAAAVAEYAPVAGAEAGAADAGDAALQPAACPAPPPPPPLPLDVRPLLGAALRGVVAGGGCAPRTLVVLLWSLAALRLQPSEAWMRALLVHSVEALPLLSPNEAEQCVWALLRLRYQPPPLWLQRLDHLARRWAAQVASDDDAVRAAAAEAASAVLQAEAAAAGGVAAQAGGDAWQAGGAEPLPQGAAGVAPAARAGCAPACAGGGCACQQCTLQRMRRRAERLAAAAARFRQRRTSLRRLARGLLRLLRNQQRLQAAQGDTDWQARCAAQAGRALGQDAGPTGTRCGAHEVVAPSQAAVHAVPPTAVAAAAR